MKQKKKCNICGSTNLREVDGRDLVNGQDVEVNFNGMVCRDCGHIDLYANKKILSADKHRYK